MVIGKKEDSPECNDDIKDKNTNSNDSGWGRVLLLLSTCGGGFVLLKQVGGGRTEQKSTCSMGSM